MKRISLAIVLLFASLAHAVDYRIVAVRAPRHGDQKISSWQEVQDPIDGEPGSSLVIINPDGTEEVLVDAGADGMVLDPSPSLDGQSVYYSFVPNQRLVNTQQRAHATYSGADIYKVSVATKEKVRLTHQEWTPAMGVAKWAKDHTGRNPRPVDGESYLGYGIYNTGPCEVPGGRVIFTSSRNGYLSPKAGYTFPNMQLFAMDTCGKNVEQVGYLNIGSALHPTLMKDGSIMWSSSESQGLRNAIIWGLWSSMPDGREWGPLMSGFVLNHAIHFQTQQPDGKIATAIYYINNNEGFGTIYRFPHKPEPPTDLHAFHSPTLAKNPVFKLLYGNAFVSHAISGFTPWGTEIVTSFANHYDIPAGKLNGQYAGKVTHPAAGPDGLLMVYSPGPVNFMQPPFWPAPQGKIAWLPYDKTSVENPSGLTIIKEDSRYNYQQPRPLLSWKDIYKSDAVAIPFNANDGTAHSKLPKGTPFGIVGTSSFYNRNSTSNGQPGEFGTIVYQGGDVGTYKNSDIYAIRIIQTLPQSHRAYPSHANTVGWKQMGPRNAVPNERLKIIGELPLRKFDADRKPILDAKGDPDTSFQARIPADVPFTFQLIDDKGKALVQSQTWHQLRPGERRVNCGGCHAHAEAPVDFNLTEASKPGYNIIDLLKPPRDVEWHRDVKAIVETECKSCHATNAAAKSKLDLTDTLTGFAGKSLSLQARISPTILAAEGQLPHTAIAPQKVRTLAEWIDLGMLVDLGEGKAFVDNINPTLTVAAPTRDEACKTIIVGAFDNESGLDKASLKVTLDGLPVELQEVGDSIWEGGTPSQRIVQSGELIVSVKDKQGNVATVKRTFNGVETLPEPPRLPVAEYLGRDVDELGDLRSTVPDGKLDHHVRLTGLKGPIEHIIIHAGATKWSDEAGEESPQNPQGTWWWVERKPDGHIYFADRGTTGNFVVFPIYSDATFDRLEVSVPTPEPPDPTIDELRKLIAALQAKITEARKALE